MERPQPQLGTQNETLVRRIIALIIDSILFFVISMAITSPLGGPGRYWGFGFAWLVSFPYFIFFEGKYGQTLGKMVVDIVVVKKDGSDCDWQASIVRNLLRIIDGFAVYLVGVVIVLLTDDNQRLGDILGETVVMKTAPAEDGRPKWSGLVISDVREVAGDRYIELRNASESQVELSGASITDDSGNRFEFAEGFLLDPDETEDFNVHESFAPDPETSLTLTTRSGEVFDIRWG